MPSMFNIKVNSTLGGNGQEAGGRNQGGGGLRHSWSRHEPVF